MIRLDVKRGASFVLRYRLQSRADAAPVDLGGYAITSDLRGLSGELVHRFAGDIDDAAAGRFRLHAPANETALWPVGTLVFDIRLAGPDAVILTRTCHLSVQEAQTRD